MKSLVEILDLPGRGAREEFGPLFSDPDLDTAWIRPQEHNPRARLIVLPGSKWSVRDLLYLRETGGEKAILEHVANGGLLFAVCGGLQICGKRLIDPYGQQGAGICAVDGLGLLPLETLFGPQMLWCRTQAQLLVGSGGTVTGEEHRSGYSWWTETSGFEPLLKVQSRTPLADYPTPQSIEGKNWSVGNENIDGLCSDQIIATYLHESLSSPAMFTLLRSRL